MSAQRFRASWLGWVVWNSLPALVFVALIFLWWLAITLFQVPAYLLPPPQDVLPELIKARQSLWDHSLITMEEIVLGFLLSVVSAIPMGLLIALSPTAKRLLYPLLVFIQLVPKIAIAPLFVVWIGFGPTSKVMLTLLLTFFPLLLASISGFQILDERFLYLTRSMGATTWQTFRYLRFPSALPVIFHAAGDRPSRHDFCVCHPFHHDGHRPGAEQHRRGSRIRHGALAPAQARHLTSVFGK
jgi:NitT/TauT family transport system permease protein